MLKDKNILVGYKKKHNFLFFFPGEVVIPEIDLTIDTPVWYRIENPETPGVKKPNQYFPDSPTPSLDGTQRSLSGTS